MTWPIKTMAGSAPLRSFYDISLDAAEYLFDPGCYRDEDGEMRNGVMPDEVIGRIESVMAELPIPNEDQ